MRRSVDGALKVLKSPQVKECKQGRMLFLREYMYFEFFSRDVQRQAIIRRKPFLKFVLQKAYRTGFNEEEAISKTQRI